MALTRSIGAYDDGTPSVPGVGTTPLDTRKSLSALWTSAGVVAGGPSPLVTGTAGFAYSVAGPVPFVTSRGPSDGFHMFTNDGAVTVPITNAAGVTLAGAPGSGLQRIDIVWVQHRTNDENSDTTSAPRFGVESGTAVSSSPVAPSLPTGALELARNTMTSAATSTASAGNSIAQTAAVAALRIGTPGRVSFPTRRGSGRLTTQPVVAAYPAWTTLATLTATTLGGLCDVNVFSTLANANSGANRIGTLSVTLDGVALTPMTIDFELVNTSSVASSAAAFNWESTPAAGSHTWVLRAAGSVGSSVQAIQAVMIVTEYP